MILRATAFSPRHATLFLAWAVMLLGSLLPDILWNELAGPSPAWLTWAKLGVFAGLIALSLVVKPLRPLRAFAAGTLTPGGWATARGWQPASAAQAAPASCAKRRRICPP